MGADEGLLLAIGATLTGLALVSGYFILAEALLLVRDWLGGGSPPGQRPRRGSGSPPEAARRERVEPLRDPDVVRQLINHFSSEEPPTGEA